MEPDPANVSGEKLQKEVQKHVFEHRIHWGYVALGIAGLAVVWILSREFGSGSQKNEDDAIGTEV